MPVPPCPSDSELATLNVLWDREPCSVREVHGVIAATNPVGYTMVLKTMQIMTDKGLVKRDERQKAHLYRSALPAPRVQKRLVDDLVERAFGGAAAQLALHALEGGEASAEEIAQLRTLLAALERKPSRKGAQR